MRRARKRQCDEGRGRQFNPVRQHQFFEGRPAGRPSVIPAGGNARVGPGSRGDCLRFGLAARSGKRRAIAPRLHRPGDTFCARVTGLNPLKGAQQNANRNGERCERSDGPGRQKGRGQRTPQCDREHKGNPEGRHRKSHRRDDPGAHCSDTDGIGGLRGVGGAIESVLVGGGGLRGAMQTPAQAGRAVIATRRVGVAGKRRCAAGATGKPFARRAATGYRDHGRRREFMSCGHRLVPLAHPTQEQPQVAT